MSFGFHRPALFTAVVPILLAAAPAPAQEAPAPDTARILTGEEMYKHLAGLSHEKDAGAAHLDRIQAAAQTADWGTAKTIAFDGNLRRFDIAVAAQKTRPFYFLRELAGEVFVLALPEDAAAQDPLSGSPYAGLDDNVGKKMIFSAVKTTTVVEDIRYTVVKLTQNPERLLLDRLFFIAIVILLFLTMVGMGLTLTVKDFAIVFKKPLGMLVGPICQFGLMPLLAMALGRAFGYYEAYPFIFLGFILISSSPGGVTSNLMTYFGKGDVALSVSLTALCTILALFFTPLLLKLYGSNIPDFSIPVIEVFKTMLVLVIVPLFVGMLVRWKAEGFAKRAEKIFALIGLFALLFLIVVGIWSNLDKFADTDRYGVRYYLSVFLLTLAGMVVSAFLAKLVRVKNYQIRAISLECGLRNASLAMTIALLLQDQMGDFYSSMFWASGIFGLWMYVAGALTIYLFPKILPVSAEELEQHKALGTKGESAS